MRNSWKSSWLRLLLLTTLISLSCLNTAECHGFIFFRTQNPNEYLFAIPENMTNRIAILQALGEQLNLTHNQRTTQNDRPRRRLDRALLEMNDANGQINTRHRIGLIRLPGPPTQNRFLAAPNPMQNNNHITIDFLGAINTLITNVNTLQRHIGGLLHPNITVNTNNIELNEAIPQQGDTTMLLRLVNHADQHQYVLEPIPPPAPMTHNQILQHLQLLFLNRPRGMYAAGAPIRSLHSR